MRWPLWKLAGRTTTSRSESSDPTLIALVICTWPPTVLMLGPADLSLSVAPTLIAINKAGTATDAL